MAASSPRPRRSKRRPCVARRWRTCSDCASSWTTTEAVAAGEEEEVAVEAAVEVQCCAVDLLAGSLDAAESGGPRSALAGRLWRASAAEAVARRAEGSGATRSSGWSSRPSQVAVALEHGCYLGWTSAGISAASRAQAASPSRTTTSRAPSQTRTRASTSPSACPLSATRSRFRSAHATCTPSPSLAPPPTPRTSVPTPPPSTRGRRCSCGLEPQQPRVPPPCTHAAPSTSTASPRAPPGCFGMLREAHPRRSLPLARPTARTAAASALRRPPPPRRLRPSCSQSSRALPSPERAPCPRVHCTHLWLRARVPFSLPRSRPMHDCCTLAARARRPCPMSLSLYPLACFPLWGARRASPLVRWACVRVPSASPVSGTFFP
mmetsp:Transcript_9911/g.29714  ORF Transcript_9911/g.29714 Transcript_9911/m.29714 type:complete len:378 (+) Transcript_9911:628-1761(+)